MHTPDIATIHTALCYLATGWISLNLGIIAGAWWATRPRSYVP